MASSSLVVHIVQLLLLMRILVFVLWRDDYEGSFFFWCFEVALSEVDAGILLEVSGGFPLFYLFLTLESLATAMVWRANCRRSWRGGGAKILLFHCSPFISCKLTTVALFTTHRPYLPSPLGHHS